MNNKVTEITNRIELLKNEVAYLKAKKYSRGLTNYEFNRYSMKKNELENLEDLKKENNVEYIKSLSYPA